MARDPAERSASKHAPGPWTAEERHPAGVHWDTVIRDRDRNPISTVKAAGWTRASASANTALIAAAPDLLTAARLALTDLQPHEWTDLPGGYAVKATVDALREAIAKAECRS